MTFDEIKRIYFIGIGGIGMSALARYFKKHGAAVYGYDRSETGLTRALAAEGMHLHYDDDVQHIPDGIDLVVFTPAVPKDHAELNWFLEKGYPVKKRAEVLGIISRAKRCVAIAGTHGKTTTSTMTAHLLRACGVDFSFTPVLDLDWGESGVIGDRAFAQDARIVTALSAAPLDEGNAAFDPTRLVVTSFDVGNPARNVIPGEATAKFNVRFNDIWTPATLGGRIAEIVAEAAQGADARVKLHPTNSISFRTQRSAFTDLVVAAIERKTGRTPDLSTTGGTSDARFIKDYCEVLEYGLVGETMHQIDERVAISDLEGLTRIYKRVIADYFETVGNRA